MALIVSEIVEILLKLHYEELHSNMELVSICNCKPESGQKNIVDKGPIPQNIANRSTSTGPCDINDMWIKKALNDENKIYIIIYIIYDYLYDISLIY